MKLLKTIEAYLRQTGVAPTRFGREAARDPRLVGDLRLGRVIGPKLSRRIEAYVQGELA